MAADLTSLAVRLQVHVKRLKKVQINMELKSEIGTKPFYSVFRQTLNSEADPSHPILDDGVDEFIREARNWPLVPEIADEDGTLRVIVDAKYLPRPRAPQAPAVPQASVPSKLDELYAPHFLRLLRDLEARSSHVPDSVTEGKVATLGMDRVSTEAGEAIFEPTLEDHVSAPAK